MSQAITEIRIKLDTGKELTLNPMEARQMFVELGRLFDQAGEIPSVFTIKAIEPVYIHTPIFIEKCPETPNWPTPWEITWAGPEYAPACGIAPTLLAIGYPSLPEWTS